VNNAPNAAALPAKAAWFALKLGMRPPSSLAPVS
jgi:hypothetical protein